jgi:hypothetical protein
MSVSWSVVSAEDDLSSNAVISLFATEPTFIEVSKKETDMILARDAEDDQKLAAGIEIAVRKGVLSAQVQVEPVITIDVYGKSADQVANEIIGHIGGISVEGCVIVMQGLSGTGKGTTVAKLQSKLPKAVTWSNGNVFRSLTLLIVTWCEQNGVSFSTDVLTPELLEECMSYLSFGEFSGKYDIKIAGLGLNYLVSEVANTELKAPAVGTNIPTVAESTQGEIIKFASSAVAQLSQGGFNVILEGRAQTLDHIRSPFRFELAMKNPTLIGMRRAAQRMVGEVAQKLKGGKATDEAVVAELTCALTRMAAEFRASEMAGASPALLQVAKRVDELQAAVVLRDFRISSMEKELAKLKEASACFGTFGRFSAALSAYAPAFTGSGDELFMTYWSINPDKSLSRTEYTRKEFMLLAQKAANVMTLRGLSKGDMVCHYFTNNTPADLAFRLAAAMVGTIPVTINWQADPIDRILYKIELTNSKMVIIDEGVSEDHLSAIKTANPGIVLFSVADLVTSEPLPIEKFSGDVPLLHPHMVIFTSGTTGNPKVSPRVAQCVYHCSPQMAIFVRAYCHRTVRMTPTEPPSKVYCSSRIRVHQRHML